GEPDDGRPVAAHTLGDGITALLAELRALLPATERATQAVAPLARAYRPGVAWHAAFMTYVGELTEGLGVAFVDPTRPDFKQAAAPLFARVIEQADDVERAVAEGARSVERPQVPYLPGELPLFVLDPEG